MAAFIARQSLGSREIITVNSVKCKQVTNEHKGCKHQPETETLLSHFNCRRISSFRNPYSCWGFFCLFVFFPHKAPNSGEGALESLIQLEFRSSPVRRSRIKDGVCLFDARNNFVLSFCFCFFVNPTLNFKTSQLFLFPTGFCLPPLPLFFFFLK